MTPTQPPLALPGEIRIWPTADQLYENLGRDLLDAATGAVAHLGVFHLALSGGSTPGPFYRHMAADGRFGHFPWQATHVWLVDERRVPEHDERNNFGVIRRALTDHVPMLSAHLHPVPVLADDPAGAYERKLLAVIGGDSIPQLDFVLLGMGDDGHTASLFPGSDALTEAKKLVTENSGPSVAPPPRITMTFRLLNAARHIAVLVTGPGKAATLRRVDEQFRRHGPDTGSLPITGIHPISGRLTWYLDTAAADR